MRPKGEVHVLMVGGGDPRHIFKTIAGLQNKESLHVSLNLLNCYVTPDNKLVHSIVSKPLCTAGVGDRKQHGAGC